mmetsp:Transcript_6930/g.17202  ORF Transcript_6930/g.17202 Transcript_6930/m.17202 type:complete len:164 (+) Transcript_6930:59-550(+)
MLTAAVVVVPRPPLQVSKGPKVVQDNVSFVTRSLQRIHHVSFGICTIRQDRISRNNGAATGYTAGGWLDMYAHPKCCFHYHILEDTTAATATGNNNKKKIIHLSCSFCETKITDGRRVVTCTAAGGKRCRRNLNRPPPVHCFGCVHQFLRTHQDLLQTVVSSS